MGPEDEGERWRVGEECCGHVGLQLAEPMARTDTVGLWLEQERSVGKTGADPQTPTFPGLWASSPGQRGATEQMEDGVGMPRHDLHILAEAWGDGDTVRPLRRPSCPPGRWWIRKAAAGIQRSRCFRKMFQREGHQILAISWL